MTEFFRKHRVLDGYIGILGFVMHYRILATYHSTLIIFSLSVRKLFSVSVYYHPDDEYYPLIEYRVMIGKWLALQNGEKARKEIDEKVTKWHEEKAAEEKAIKKEVKDLLPNEKHNLIDNL